MNIKSVKKNTRVYRPHSISMGRQLEGTKNRSWEKDLYVQLINGLSFYF